MAITFTTKRYADLTEVVCTEPAPICPSEQHTVAVISHQPGMKWSVMGFRLGERKAFKTLAEAKQYVSDQ